MESRGLIPRRSGAYVLDCSLVFATLVLPQLLLSLTVGGLPQERLRTGARFEAWFLLTISLPIWLYFALFERSPWQATPGQRLLGLRVAGVAGVAGERIGVGRALLRTGVKMVPWELTHLALFFPTPFWLDETFDVRPALAVAYVLMAAYLAAILRSRGRRGLQDLAAGTVVARALREDLPQSL